MNGTIKKFEKVPDLVSRSIVSVKNAKKKPGAVSYDNDAYELKMGNLIKHVNRLLITLKQRVAMSKHLYHKCAAFLEPPDVPENLFSIVAKFLVVSWKLIIRM